MERLTLRKWLLQQGPWNIWNQWGRQDTQERLLLSTDANSYKAIPDSQGCEVVILNTCASSLGDPSLILGPLIKESQILKSGFHSVKRMHSSWSLYWLIMQTFPSQKCPWVVWPNLWQHISQMTICHDGKSIFLVGKGTSGISLATCPPSIYWLCFNILLV